MTIHKAFYKQFMNGFTYIIPLAVVGGVFLNLYHWFNLDVYKQISDLSFLLIYPVFSGSIAYGISDRPGLILGFIGGAMVSFLGESGFLGALIIGFASGYLITLFQIIFNKFPRNSKGILPVFIYPVLGVFMIIWLFMGLDYVIPPINEWISLIYISFDLWILIVISMILGIMIVYDLGGPINKIAYVIGVVSILGNEGNVLMTSIMLSGMLPPLSIAICASLFRNKFSDQEKRIANHNYLTGLSFITEGALPFMHKSKYIKSIFYVGAILVSLSVVLFNVTLNVAHGGILALLFVNHWYIALLILIGSSFISAILLGLFLPKIEKNLNV